MSLRHATKYAQHRGHRLVTAPAQEPITLAQVKDQLRIDGTDDDTKLTLYIEAAREQCEKYTGLSLITQTWRMTLDHWPTVGREPWWDGARQGSIGELYSRNRASQIFLPRYPLQTVDSLKADGSAITVSDYFTTDTTQFPGRLVLKFGQTFPPIVNSANAVDIDYTAGYGDDPSDVPAPLRLALIQMVAFLFEHSGDGCSAENAMVQSGAKSVFDNYKARLL